MTKYTERLNESLVGLDAMTRLLEEYNSEIEALEGVMSTPMTEEDTFYKMEMDEVGGNTLAEGGPFNVY